MLLRIMLLSAILLTTQIVVAQTGGAPNNGSAGNGSQSSTPQNGGPNETEINGPASSQLDPSLEPLLEALSERLLQDIRKELAGVPERVTKNESDIADLRGNLNNALAAIQQLEATVADLNTSLRNQVEGQREILDAISTKDSNQQSVLRLSTIMDNSDEFRQDVQNAVHRSLRTVGQFTVVNKTNSYRRIWVNKKEHGLSAGERLTLDEPVGTVTTQLPGQRLENWTLAAPSYAEEIEIVPDRYTALRPTAPVSATSVYRPSLPTSTLVTPVSSFYAPIVHQPATTVYYYQQPYSSYSWPWYSVLP